jgi:LPS O-antigen subunit length determinant protein (WzzB/FepE family)
MANNINQSSYQEDEMDLREILKALIESKKLIISTILIFTTASIFYSLSLKPEFKSSSLFEIGYYEMLDGSRQLIEKPSELIDDMKFKLIIKNPDNEFNQAVAMLPIPIGQTQLIQFETTSFSSKKNEQLLNKFFSYIDNRHASFMKLNSDNNRKDLHNQIDLIESEFELERLNITNEISKKSANILFLDQKISQLRKIITDNNNILLLLKNDPKLFIDRTQISPDLNLKTSEINNSVSLFVRGKNILLLDIENLNNKLEFENNSTQFNKLLDLKLKQEALEIELESADNQKIINSGLIGDIKITTIKPKYLLTTTLGIVLGFISSIFLVFIRSFIKNFRESEA